MQLSQKTLKNFENILPSVLYEYTQNHDGNNIIRYVSPNSREILGYPAEKFIGNSTSSFLEIVVCVHGSSPFELYPGKIGIGTAEIGCNTLHEERERRF
jgi:PAS domain-containing protein